MDTFKLAIYVNSQSNYSMYIDTVTFFQYLAYLELNKAELMNYDFYREGILDKTVSVTDIVHFEYSNYKSDVLCYYPDITEKSNDFVSRCLNSFKDINVRGLSNYDDRKERTKLLDLIQYFKCKESSEEFQQLIKDYDKDYSTEFNCIMLFDKNEFHRGNRFLFPNRSIKQHKGTNPVNAYDLFRCKSDYKTEGNEDINYNKCFLFDIIDDFRNQYVNYGTYLKDTMTDLAVYTDDLEIIQKVIKNNQKIIEKLLEKE